MRVLAWLYVCVWVYVCLGVCMRVRLRVFGRAYVLVRMTVHLCMSARPPRSRGPAKTFAPCPKGETLDPEP